MQTVANPLSCGHSDCLVAIFMHIETGSMFKTVRLVSQDWRMSADRAHPTGDEKFANNLATILLYDGIMQPSDRNAAYEWIVNNYREINKELIVRFILKVSPEMRGYETDSLDRQHDQYKRIPMLMHNVISDYFLGNVEGKSRPWISVSQFAKFTKSDQLVLDPEAIDYLTYHKSHTWRIDRVLKHINSSRDDRISFEAAIKLPKFIQGSPIIWEDLYPQEMLNLMRASPRWDVPHEIRPKMYHPIYTEKLCKKIAMSRPDILMNNDFHKSEHFTWDFVQQFPQHPWEYCYLKDASWELTLKYPNLNWRHHTLVNQLPITDESIHHFVNNNPNFDKELLYYKNVDEYLVIRYGERCIKETRADTQTKGCTPLPYIKENDMSEIFTVRPSRNLFSQLSSRSSIGCDFIACRIMDKCIDDAIHLRPYINWDGDFAKMPWKIAIGCLHNKDIPEYCQHWTPLFGN